MSWKHCLVVSEQRKPGSICMFLYGIMLLHGYKMCLPAVLRWRGKCLDRSTKHCSLLSRYNEVHSYPGWSQTEAWMQFELWDLYKFSRSFRYHETRLLEGPACHERGDRPTQCLLAFIECSSCASDCLFQWARRSKIMTVFRFTVSFPTVHRVVAYNPTSLQSLLFHWLCSPHRCEDYLALNHRDIHPYLVILLYKESTSW